MCNEAEHPSRDAGQKAEKEKRSVGFDGVASLPKLRITLVPLSAAEPGVDAAVSFVTNAVEQVV